MSVDCNCVHVIIDRKPVSVFSSMQACFPQSLSSVHPHLHVCISLSDYTANERCGSFQIKRCGFVSSHNTLTCVTLLIRMEAKFDPTDVYFPLYRSCSVEEYDEQVNLFFIHAGNKF